MILFTEDASSLFCLLFITARHLFIVGIGDNRTDEERVNELNEKRTSKFLNRALPDPPTPQNSGLAEKGSCPEELRDLYDLIAQSAVAGEMYEDIDNCLERSDSAAPASFNDSSSSSTSRSSSVRQAASNLNPPDDEYLEPVIPPEEEIRQSSGWRPLPAPRSSVSAMAEGIIYLFICLQCFDAVGWVAGRASGL